MSVCLFLSFWTDAACWGSGSSISTLAAMPKLAKALVHSRASADDPYLKDDKPPQLVLQLYFAGAARTSKRLAIISRR